MKVIKCGGNVLSKFEDRKRLYQEIKNEKDKIVLVVSAFNDCPYSTKSLKKLLTNNTSYEMEQELIILGEIISSIRVCNELINEYIDAGLIYKEELGIYVNSSDKMDDVIKLDSTHIKEKVNEHKVVVIPGFIGINQHNRFVSLNANGSDLTAILVAKMLDLKQVYLYKDVLGLASINPKIYKDYKLYNNVSYSLMQQIILHGSDLIQEEAINKAKEYNIDIYITHYLNHSYFTNISKFNKEKVLVFQNIDNCIYIDGYSNKEIIESLLINKNILFDYILPCNSFVKIVTSHYNESIILHVLHSAYLKGEI